MAKSNYYTPRAEAMRLVPGVTHTKWDTRMDVYTGDAVALIKSGVVQEHMLPAPGRYSISWRAIGAKQPGNSSAHWEPGYTTIRRSPAGDGFRVEVVVSREEQKIRHADYERKKDQSEDGRERANSRAKAEASLKAMPVDADDYRMQVVENMRLMMAFIKAEPVDWHGFTLTEEGVEGILMSCDAVVEAILQAEVHFDEQRHRQIKMKHQQQIAEADESFQNILGNLTSAQPQILEGGAT